MNTPNRLPEDDAFSLLAEALAPIEPPPVRRAALRERILAAASVASVRSVTIHPAEGEWQTIAHGVTLKMLHDHGDAQSFLVKMAPGSSLPGHHHHREELCMVLDGQVRLGDVEAGAGTYHLALAGSDHGLITTATGCLLFIRAPLDAANAF